MSTEPLPSPPTPSDDTRRQWHRLFGIALTTTAMPRSRYHAVVH